MTRKSTAALAVAAAGATIVVGAPAASADTPPEHAVIVCDSATMYQNYDHMSGPVNPIRILYRDNRVGHTRGKHPVYNGWAAIMDFGPNDWGYVRYECLGGWGSW